VALGLEPVIEHVDRSHLVRGGEAGLIVDHGNEVLHLKIVSCGVEPVRKRDFKPSRTAGGRPGDLDRHTLRVDSRLDQVERKVRTGDGRTQTCRVGV
jgi:hypothetical protein